MTPEQQMAAMFGGPQGPSPEQAAIMAVQQAHAERVQQAAWETELLIRRMTIDYAWLYCRCRRWYKRDDDPPQAQCVVHGSVLVSFDGKQAI